MPKQRSKAYLIIMMSETKRVVVVEIKFEFSEENLNEGQDAPLTDEQLIEYAKESFTEDVYAMVKHNEVWESSRARIEERE